MASAKDQDAAISNDPHATPTKDYNFCQRNIMTVSENALQALQEKEIEYGMAEFKEQAFLDFRYQAETQTIFGPRTLVDGVADGENFIDPITQKRKLHMRGLLDFNIQNVTIPRNDPDAAINSMMEQMFSVNNGSEERIMLYGAGFATFLANSKLWTKQMDAKSTEVKFGIRWKTIESNFGVLRCIYHPALSLLGPYTDCAIIIDPANIRRVDQIKLHQRTAMAIWVSVTTTATVVVMATVEAMVGVTPRSGMMMSLWVSVVAEVALQGAICKTTEGGAMPCPHNTIEI